MTDLLKLSAEWRLYHATQKGLVPQARYHIEACANQLDAALPVWTKITDCKPEAGQWILYRCKLSDGWSELIQTKWHNDSYARESNVYWRPLCSIDTPPQESE